MAYGAKGIARQDGKVYFVPHTLPGDEIEGRVVADKGRYAEVDPQKWLIESGLRRQAPCRFFARCGGCQWLNVETEVQLGWKKEFLLSAIRRIGKLQGLMEPEIWPSRTQLSWRNRIRLRVRPLADGRLGLGFLQQGSNQWLPVDECIIAAPEIRAFMVAWQQEPPRLNVACQMELQEAFGRAEGKQGVLVTLIREGQGPVASLDRLVAEVQRMPGVLWADRKLAVPKAPFFLLDRQEDVNFYIKPGQFSQVNPEGNQRLRAAVKAFAQQVVANRILDVYCGHGNLSLLLHAQGRTILGVEASAHSISAAQYSVAENQLSGSLRYVRGDGQNWLAHCARHKEEFDLVICDPPREGMGKGLQSLLSLGPRALVLVGCEPNHFARDLGKCLQKGYDLQRLILADFFPGTFHLESIAFLTRR